jgi:heptaprenyl diphosphate synthase
MEEYLRNIHGKTAALFMAACRIGAEESGCSETIVKEMETFGECLGIMFQLRDDLLDFISTSDNEGKETHKDFQEGIYTMPVICALKNPKAADELVPILRANREGTLKEGQLQRMEQLAAELGGIEATLREIYERQFQAEHILLSSMPQNEQVLTLLAMIRKLGDIRI